MTTLRAYDLLSAVRVGNADVIKERANLLEFIRTPSGKTVLGVATELNQVECVKVIFSLCPKLLYECVNHHRDTALHIAARWGHAEIIETLLAKAPHIADEQKEKAKKRNLLIRRTNQKNYTALHEAVCCHHLHVVEILLKEDPRANWDLKHDGESPLYLAATKGYTNVGLSMIQLSSSDKLYQSNRSNGRNPLQATIVSNLQELTDKLMRERPNLAREWDMEGWTPLHWAARYGLSSRVSQLLAFDETLAHIRGADDGVTALHVAARMGSLSTSKALLSKSPYCYDIVDKNGRNALHHAVIGGNIETILGILENPWFSKHVNDPDHDGNTALHLLASLGHSPLIPHLLMSHPKIDLLAVNHEGLTISEITTDVKYLEVKCEELQGGRRNPRSRKPFNDSRQTLSDQEKELERQERKKKREAFLEKVGQSHLVVAALIATVTFAAGFTLPGGYNDEGKAILFKRAAFIVFIISDIVALVLSLLAVYVYFICATAQDPSDEENGANMEECFRDDNLPYYERLYKCGLHFTMSATFATTVAFMSGVYVTLDLSIVTVTIFGVGGSSLVAFLVIFYRRFPRAFPRLCEELTGIVVGVPVDIFFQLVYLLKKFRKCIY